MAVVSFCKSLDIHRTEHVEILPALRIRSGSASDPARLGLPPGPLAAGRPVEGTGRPVTGPRHGGLPAWHDRGGK